MSILSFRRPSRNVTPVANLSETISGYSIEVMPRTAAKIDDFRSVLPQGTRVYVAHIDGTGIDEMVATARRLGEQGFDVMPHVPARSVRNRAELDRWVGRYADEAGVRQALVLAGGIPTPRGDFHSSMQLLETGVFDRHGFTRLHVAGHPEGNRDIDPDGGDRAVGEALSWKQAFAQRTDAQMALATQFAFDADAIAAWARRLQDNGMDLPIHAGIAGPAKLQTLIKFAVACGVGPSMAVLQRRAMDVSKLLVPYEPTDVLSRLTALRAQGRTGGIEQIHFFPLGGIGACADWAAKYGGTATQRAAVSG
ncbi:methylenetetrahydrofolate reductase [Tranquillimonas rosea]|uniref:methylenetetrahydrofolate reductase n=1 Tax=Tranquillimonas rosea TaxID=641238 RepID=UPI003BAC8D94